MRNTAGWRRRLLDAARTAGVREADRVLVDAELGLYLLSKVDPKAPSSALWAYLSGYQFAPGQAPESDRLCAVARYYLGGYRAKRRWEQLLNDYTELPEVERLYTIADRNAPATCRLTQLAVWRERVDAYDKLLTSAPGYRCYQWEPAPAGKYVVEDRTGTLHNVEITAEDLVHRPNLASVPFPPPERRPPKQIAWTELEEAAQYLDAACTSGDNGPILRNLLDRMQYLESDGAAFRPAEAITVEGTRHIVGRVGAGKTTLMRVLGGWAHLTGRRVALVVGDVATAVEMAAWFRRRGVKAIPILGYSGRGRHIAQLHRMEQVDGLKPIEARFDGYRWAAPVCALIADPISPGDEPCRQALQTPDRKERFDCPFPAVCPVYAGARELMDASVWITTPQALVYHQVLTAVLPERVRLAELVYRCCDQVVVDECDRVQAQLDTLFGPDEVLVGSRNSLLDRLSLQLPPQVVSRPYLMANTVVKEWLNALDLARNAARTLIHRLSRWKRPSHWLREEEFFTAWTLLLRVARRCAGLSERVDGAGSAAENDEARKHEERLIEEFTKLLEDPLGREGHELGQLALRLADLDDEADHQRVADWVQKACRPDVQSEEAAAIAQLLCTALVMLVLENALQELVSNWDTVASELDLEGEKSTVFRDFAADYRPVLVEPPTGALFGFQYSRDPDAETGVLKVLRLTESGRDLLLRFPHLFEALDGVRGANVLLTSGTSWAPASNRFHLQLPVHGILEAVGVKEPKIEFAFTPLFDGDRPIVVSGRWGEERDEALRKMTRRLVERGAAGLSRLEWEREHWKRERGVLLVVGSYAEADSMYETVLQCRPDLTDAVEKLVRDADARFAGEGERPRGMVAAFARSGKWLLIAPLQAIERGHNIVDEDGGAYIGTACFLVRPMPRVDDLSRVAAGLNRWGVEQIARRRGTGSLSQAEALGHFRRDAIAELFRLLRSVRPYAQMDEKDREELLWTQAVTIWQTIGRLVRGGSDARVLFVDAAFAPGTADSNRPADTPATSFLHGLRAVLTEAVEGDDQERSLERAVAGALYRPMIDALARIGGLS